MMHSWGQLVGPGMKGPTCLLLQEQQPTCQCCAVNCCPCEQAHLPGWVHGAAFKGSLPALHSPDHEFFVLIRLCLQAVMIYCALQGQRRQATMQSWSLWTLHIWGTGRLMSATGEPYES